MNSDKKTARIIGVLFFVATVAYMTGNGFLAPILKALDLVDSLHLNKIQVILGAFLELINAAAVVGIGVLLFRIVKKYHERIALGYLASRIIESALLVVSIISLLLLRSVQIYHSSFNLAMISLGLGSLLLCYALYKSRLIPRVIAVLGFIGYAALLLWGVSELSGYATGFTLFIPGALFEIIFPIWLIVKGFNPSAISLQSARINN